MNDILQITKNTFDETNLSAHQRTRLTAHLDELENISEARYSYLENAVINLTNAFITEEASSKRRIYIPSFLETLPEEKINLLITDNAEDLIPADRIPTLVSMPHEEKLKYFSLAYKLIYTAVPKRKETQFINQLSRQYARITGEYTNILYLRDDIEGAVRFGETFKRQNRQEFKSKHITERFHTLIDQAYPNEQFEGTHISVLDQDFHIASYMHDSDGGTFTFKTLPFDQAQETYVFSHEYQHRRQHNLTDSYTNGKIDKDSNLGLHCRLLDINGKGGHIVSSPFNNLFRNAVIGKHYAYQPTELQADHIGRLACLVGESGGDRVSEHRMRSIDRQYYLLRPFDFLFG